MNSIIASRPQVLGSYLPPIFKFSNELLGQPAPRLSHAPRSDAMAALRETESRDGFHFQIDDLKSAHDYLQSLLSQTMANRDRLRSEVEQLNSELENANRVRGELNIELENANCARGELERKLTGLQSESIRLSTELKNTSRARGELERKLTGDPNVEQPTEC